MPSSAARAVAIPADLQPPYRRRSLADSGSSKSQTRNSLCSKRHWLKQARPKWHSRRSRDSNWQLWRLTSRKSHRRRRGSAFEILEGSVVQFAVDQFHVAPAGLVTAPLNLHWLKIARKSDDNLLDVRAVAAVEVAVDHAPTRQNPTRKIHLLQAAGVECQRPHFLTGQL